MSKKLKIIFLGTAEFAVESLRSIYESEHELVAVVTIPDKQTGRGLIKTESPVKIFAKENDIAILQPKNLRDPKFIEELKDLKPDLQIVVAFKMLPEMVWGLPKYGTVNLHASLLPNYRGAAPINWAIINGENETGVTTFFIDQHMDTGKIAFQEKEPILNSDTAGDLYQRLKVKGAKLIIKTIKYINEGNCPKLVQKSPDPSFLKVAKKIHKEDCKINWESLSKDIFNFVRGLNPLPSAWTTINNKYYKIHEVEISDQELNLQPGQYKSDHKTFLMIGTNDRPVFIKTIQAEGKKKMKIEDFLKGNKV